MNVDNVSRFKDCLLDVVNKNGINQSNWGSTDWIESFNFIDQNVLNDAFNKHALINEIFKGIGDTVQRKCKTNARVQIKMEEKQRVGSENYFKVVSDFAALRIHCNLNEIMGKIDFIKKIVLENNGQMFIRDSWDHARPISFIDSTGKFQDITQYVYVFLKEVGYPIEIQMGHQFASHTFTIDSALRDNKECGEVDLWSKDFYSKVSKYIKDKANGEQNLGDKTEIYTICKEIHEEKGKAIPEKLKEILDSI
ncbi:MAG: hypothetical protein H0U27_08780 [Nitrosopumilus sp.]|nr:hypothetical protein [Nitrosopumilus sp.]